MSDQTKLKASIIHVSNLWLQAESHNEAAKEAIAAIAEEHQIDKKDIAKIAKIYHKQNLEQVRTEADAIINQYEEIFGL